MRASHGLTITRRTKQGLQVQWLTLRARGKADVSVFPMIHVADAHFFSHVMAEADAHDLVLREGIGPGPAGRTASKAYRNASKGRSGLKAEPAAPANARATWINSDLKREEFNKRWSQLPLWQRLVFHVALRLMGVVLRFGKARAWLIEALSDTHTDTGEALESLFGKDLRKLVLDDRDAALLQACDTAISNSAKEDRIAVIWGAAHIPPMVHALVNRHGYRIATREWVTAVTTDAPDAAAVKGSETCPVHIPAGTAMRSDHHD